MPTKVPARQPRNRRMKDKTIGKRNDPSLRSIAALEHFGERRGLNISINLLAPLMCGTNELI